jgi:hypothetical protein
MLLSSTGAFTLKGEDISGERVAASAQAVAEVRTFGDIADELPEY